MEVEGRSAFKLKEKLKGWKYKLKEWCNVNVGRLEDKIKVLKKSWDVKGELVDLEANEIEAGREIVAQLYR